MPVDLDKIRALLASVAGFTEGPWRIAYTAGQGGVDSSKVYTDAIGGYPVCIGDVNRYRYVPADQKLFAAAPDLHRELMEAVGEIERLRLVVGWAEADALGTSNALALVTEQAKKDCAERDTEIERLRAHNARMVAQINRLAEGCGRAARHRDPSYPAIGHIITTLPGECAGQDWADLFAAADVALGRLAAGEVDDV